MRISLEDLKLDCIIGILPSERITPQKISVNCIIDYTFEGNNFIDYSVIRDLIREDLISKKYELLESATANLIQIIKSKFQTIEYISISISKLEIFEDCVVSLRDEKRF